MNENQARRILIDLQNAPPFQREAIDWALDEIEQLRAIKEVADRAMRMLSGGHYDTGESVKPDTYQTRSDAALLMLHNVFETTKDKNQ